VDVVIGTLGPTFLRPRFLVADVVRGLTLVSLVVATIGWGGTAFPVMALCLLGVVVPRTLGLRPAFDVLVCVLVLVAGWSSVLEWYTSVFLWDKVVHVLLTGLLAAVAYVIAADLRVVRPATDSPLGVVVIVTAVAAFGIGAVWEIGEWAGHTYVDSAIFVGYVDTVGDLAADGLGGVLAGFGLPWLAAERTVVQPTRRGADRV
jgi:hypothetical protein